ncbi:ABC transporter permease [Carboxydochorda subterranea]|uniref:ABC transporter permease n=1 Tax=Carboxydichorda subterranea TaxID=3109565 RepID=A0ABZ1BWM2_9FIRM|nr:ABC transporter permease [Limnochorda sp. L945t]WRP17202.1 ABC transporter permease [Limnochorda sp. L945t]
MAQELSLRVHPEAPAAPSGLARAWARLRRDPVMIAAALVVAGLLGGGLLAPLLTPYSPHDADVLARLEPPGSSGHLLGTDHLGRDLLARLLYGGRTSLLVGFAAVLLAMAIGVPVGLISGFYGGRVDAVLMRLVDVLMAFPSVLLAIAIIAALGPGLMKTMVAVAIVGVPYYARIVRGLALSLKEKEFVEAARGIGAPAWWIMVRHILPHSSGPLLVAATLDVGWMITAAAGMSFLGLGAQPPTAEWGIMLSEGRQYIRVAPHVSVLPGMAIFLVVLSLNLLGDGLRDLWDPHQRGSGESAGYWS